MKRFFYVCLSALLLTVATPSKAGTKEELLRLQNDVLALQNQIRLLQQTFTERADGLKSLIGQLNDQVAQSNQMITKVSAALESQVAGGRTVDQTLLQEIKSLSGKLDDQSTRISALAQQIADLKVQAKPIGQDFQSPAPGGSPAGAVSPDSVYNAAYNDLVQGNFDLAIQGFTSFVQNFPGSDKADDSAYNIGEAYYNQNKLPQAIAAFTRVLNDYLKGDKVPSALFKRGKTELLMQEKDNAIEDFKAVIDKYPDAAEAGLAKGELQSLGVDISKPARPAAPRRRKP
jgi:tol-pal system protein YbgF